MCFTLRLNNVDILSISAMSRLVMGDACYIQAGYPTTEVSVSECNAIDDRKYILLPSLLISRRHVPLRVSPLSFCWLHGKLGSVDSIAGGNNGLTNSSGSKSSAASTELLYQFCSVFCLVPRPFL